jgi:hypothetical protein
MILPSMILQVPDQQNDGGQNDTLQRLHDFALHDFAGPFQHKEM